MVKLTKSQQNETVRTYYGINLRTCKIELVFLKRDGRLVNHSATPPYHYLYEGRSAEDEIPIVWHLGHLISYVPGEDQRDWVKQEITALREKAAAMKPRKKVEES